MTGNKESSHPLKRQVKSQNLPIDGDLGLRHAGGGGRGAPCYLDITTTAR